MSVIGGLIWVDWSRDVMSTIVTNLYSDQDMQDPADWYGGFKEARVIKFGSGERALSNARTGDWTGSTFDLLISDYDRSIRQRSASATDRYWTEALTIRMTTRANRAVRGLPYTVFVGPIIEAQPVSSLQWRLTLGDAVSQGILNDQHQIPYRLIRDGFLDQLIEVPETLDPMTPEPIIYGIHLRQIGPVGSPIDPASPQGFVFVPIYLGIESSAGSPPGGPYHVWLVAGHAVADIPDFFIDGVVAAEGSEWLVPHHPGYFAAFGAVYEDRRSSTYGIDRRYTLIRGLVGATDPDAVAAGTKRLTISVEGTEPVGDGSGAVITDRFDQWKHWTINYVANRGAFSYQSGSWLANPTWTMLFEGNVPIVDEASFDACKAIGVIRTPSTGSPVLDGYVGAAILGATPAGRQSVRYWIAAWNRSCSTRFGVTHRGQLRIVMLHPTAAIKAAAPLYTDAYEILKGSYGANHLWSEQANRRPFVADPWHEAGGKWITTGIADALAAIHLYGRDIIGDQLELPFAPGITAATHLARIDVLQSQHPPRVVMLEASVGPFYQTGPTDPGESLGYLDLGDYIRIQHFDAVGSPSEERLNWIEWHQVQAGTRKVAVGALDCEDLIDFDLPGAAPVGTGSPGSPGPPGSSGTESCADAIAITEAEAMAIGGYTIELDTTLNGTDATATGFCGSGVAYHAAWWGPYTPTSLQKGHVTTGTSDYDTVLSVWTGSCGSLTLLDCNDNDGIFQTSFLELPTLNIGESYYFLASGYGPSDAGLLVFTFFAEPW